MVKHFFLAGGNPAHERQDPELLCAQELAAHRCARRMAWGSLRDARVHPTCSAEVKGMLFRLINEFVMRPSV